MFNEILSFSRLESLCHFCAAHIALSPPLRSYCSCIEFTGRREFGHASPKQIPREGLRDRDPLGNSQWGLSSVHTPNGCPSCFKHMKSQHQTRCSHSSIHTSFKGRDERGSCSCSQQVGKSTRQRDPTQGLAVNGDAQMVLAGVRGTLRVLWTVSAPWNPIKITAFFKGEWVLYR